MLNILHAIYSKPSQVCLTRLTCITGLNHESMRRFVDNLKTERLINETPLLEFKRTHRRVQYDFVPHPNRKSWALTETGREYLFNHLRSRNDEVCCVL